MYITLSWRALDGVDDAAVKDDVITAFHAAPFENVIEAFDGQILANVGRNRSRDDVDALDDALSPAAKNRFHYVLCCVPRGQYLWRSRDIPGAACDALAEF